MRFAAPQPALAHALAAAGRATARNGSLPSLTSVRVEASADGTVAVTGTDLDLTITARVACDVETVGVVILPARLVADIVKSFNGDRVTVDGSDRDQVVFADRRSRFEVRTSARPDDYPNLPRLDGPASTVDVAQFTTAINQVTVAASTDDARPILTGVNFTFGDVESEHRLVATDSYRLALCDVPGIRLPSTGAAMNVPARALNELLRNLGDNTEIGIRATEQSIEFTAGDIIVRSRLIAGDYPNYRGLLRDDYPHMVTVDRAELVDAVRRVKVISGAGVPVRLHIGEQQIGVTVRTQDVGAAAETVDASGYTDPTGDGMRVAFNINYLLEALAVIVGDTATFKFVDPLKPVLVAGDGDHGYTHLLMPVRA